MVINEYKYSLFGNCILACNGIFITRNIKTVDSEYFVLDKTEKTFGLTMSFYASGMGLWILTSPAEVAWYGLGYDIYGYAISAALLLF